MIVHYNPESLTITSICAKLLESAADPYIETDDPVVEQIFLAKEKIYHYRVEIIDERTHTGKLVKKIQTTTRGKRHSIDSYYYRMPVGLKDAEFIAVQNTKDKTVSFKISDQALAQWIEHQSAPLPLLACVPDDPYSMLWSIQLTPLNFGHPINYTGSDNICFYTKKLFESYQHVIT